jgi:hypothetical protein
MSRKSASEKPEFWFSLDAPNFPVLDPVHVNRDKDVTSGFIGQIGSLLERQISITSPGHHDLVGIALEEALDALSDVQGDLLFDQALWRDGAFVLSAMPRIQHHRMQPQRQDRRVDRLRSCQRKVGVERW